MHEVGWRGTFATQSTEAQIQTHIHVAQRHTCIHLLGNEVLRLCVKGLTLTGTFVLANAASRQRTKGFCPSVATDSPDAAVLSAEPTAAAAATAAAHVILASETHSFKLL